MDAARLFGPLSVTWDGRPCDLGGPRHQSILAVLLLECGHPVAAETLIARVWDDEPPDGARNTLTVYISRFRRDFLRPDGTAAKIVSQTGGYALHAEPERVDLHRFRRLRKQAVAISASGDDDRAVALLREADEQVRGEPLAGLPGRWMQSMRRSLAEEVRAARKERIELELRLGRHADVVSELYLLAAQHPTDEGLVQQLMTALYRCDRQIDALRVYQDTRALLRREYGSEPGERLRALHERILRQDVGLAVTPRYRGNRDKQPHTLLPLPDTLLGRDTELAELVRAATDRTGPTVQIIQGMAGVGKTALALTAAHVLTRRRPDAQLFLNLRSHDPEQPPLSAAAALSELLRMLLIPAQLIPRSPEDRAALWQRELADRRAVIVLDDVAEAGQIEPLIPHSSNCHVLVTSRRGMQALLNARHVPLGVLGSADATALLAHAAGGTDLDRDPAALEIVRRLGNLPMAIRLAAATLRDRHAGDTAAFAADLASSETDRTLSLESPAMTTAFALSYRRLGPAEQSMLRCLAFSPCPRITVKAAAVQAGVTVQDARLSIGTLVDHHLLNPDDQGGYTLHDLIRSFARDCGHAEDTRTSRRRDFRRLLAFYLESVRAADHALHPFRRRFRRLPAGSPPDVSAAREFLAAEWMNALAVARYAIRHEGKQDGASLILAMSRYLEASGLREEASEACALALQAFRSLDDRHGVGQAQFELGLALFRSGRPDEALQHGQEATAQFRALGETAAMAEAIDWNGVFHWSTGRTRVALAYHQEAWTFYRKIGDRSGEAQALSHAGIVFSQLGRYPEAVQHLNDALVAFRAVGDRRGEGMTLNNLGEVLRHRGLHRDAMALYRESLQLLTGIVGRQYEAINCSNLGSIWHYKGEYDRALAHFREAIVVFRAFGDLRNVASVLNSIGASYHQMEQHSEALIHHRRAHETAESVNDSQEIMQALVGTADAECGLGDHARALETYRAALRLARELDDPLQEGRIHDGIGTAVLHVDGPEAARIHWRQAFDLFQEIGAPEAQALRIRLDIMDDGQSATG
ncbi:AfsR/SARP family transcriptional regulator [Actinocorallia libanotica]|uniref:BTAD domain-containing putative transcriptional regulator n=1 Tax=Actinocorallia libanotica TaxID=46162 RepID=A0ABN1Q769_9ACTN